MPYPERIKDASYTAPSGASISFDFEVVTREVNHRIGTFEFSGVNGTLHQDKGVSGEIYPLDVFVHGPDYDLEADRFVTLAKETGPGFLFHPRWGKKRVQILSITQSENLVEEGGQALFVVKFQETLEREFPKTGTAPQQKVTALADDAQTEAINNFGDQVNVEDLADELAQEQEIISSGNKVFDTLSSVASSVQSVATRFRGHIDNVINKANEYVQLPFEYAFQITSAIRVVSEIPGRIDSQLQGFQNLLNVLDLRDITEAFTQSKNKLLIDELLATSTVVSASESVNQAFNETSTLSRDSKGKAAITVPEVGTGFQSREEVLAAVVYLRDNSQAITDMLDAGQVVFEDSLLSDSYIQSVQSYVSTWEVAGTVIKAGLDLSFSLPIKRSIILPKSRTILDLSYEFYKNIDDITLDYLILTNSLTGNDIIEVPRGKEIVFYE